VAIDQRICNAGWVNTGLAFSVHAINCKIRLIIAINNFSIPQNGVFLDSKDYLISSCSPRTL
jgi:hypothetical protein